MTPSAALLILIGGIVAAAAIAELTERREVPNGQWAGFLQSHDELFN